MPVQSPRRHRPSSRPARRGAVLRALVIAAVAWLVLASATHATSLRVRFPAEESARDARRAYPIALLRLALEKSDVDFALVPSPLNAPQARALRLVEQGELDVMWSVSTPERERQLRAVRFPIDRGLIGWRVLLVHRDAAPPGVQAGTLTALKPLLGVQGPDWPDLPILRANGLRVAAGASYDSLFDMVAQRHADYFPRSVNEVDGELAARRDMPLAIAPGVVLHYPSALYFFVRRDNAALADALATGLERARRDGALDRLFRTHYGATLARLDLAHRRVIELRNPQLPAGAPLARRELWWSPR